jgi:hypothetical protein
MTHLNGMVSIVSANTINLLDWKSAILANHRERRTWNWSDYKFLVITHERAPYLLSANARSLVSKTKHIAS